ncbi:DUF2800 domain-containing protein [Corynebacterium glucuronolyticum]|uniref:DUF2800 domain-containing protein n=2 Tax=Corynebacterium glucuronolyticum TaxID=39791 RepID=A0A7T4JW89_9CORY|nr:DUF2800 domain-containing protein [Corynebacterium glucuronolyticum]
MRFQYPKIRSLGVIPDDDHVAAHPDGTAPTKEKTAEKTPDEEQDTDQTDTRQVAHADRAHAVLSASSASRWLHCTPSALHNAVGEHRETEATRQGTAAHELAEWKAHSKLLPETEPQTLPADVDAYRDTEMDRYTDEYVSFITDTFEGLKPHGAVLLLEQRLDFSKWVPEGFGTGDAVIIADDTIHVIDLKYGAGVLVDVEENPQLSLYGLGAIGTFGDLYDLEKVKLTIYQPRRGNIGTWETTVDALLDWGESIVKPAADLAIKGEGDYQAGDWCQFCRIRATCTARAEENLALARYEFAPAAELTDEQLAEIMQQIPKFKKWAADVERYMTAQAVDHGRTYPGLKVVAGRAIRKYIDEQKVADAAIEAGYPDVFDKKLIGITAMERYLGKKTFQEVLGELVHKPAGKPMLVPESDKRPAIKIGAEAEFNDLDQGAA